MFSYMRGWYSAHIDFAAWPMEGSKVPDADPMDNLGHGTHVSGIIAGMTDL